MCYPKPGPRCSAHTLSLLSKAKVDLMNLQNTVKGNSSKTVEKDFLVKRKLIQKLEEEFFTTPAGLKELREQIETETNNLEKFKLTQKLELGERKRASQLAAVKAKEDSDGHASVEFEAKTYGHSSFEDKSNTSSEELYNFLDDSSNWAGSLTTDEIDAVRWYSKRGYISIYDYQHKHSIGKEVSAEFIESKINNLNSALAKYERDTPVIVYRGLNIHKGRKLSFSEASSAFAVGDEYSYESFSSTSLNKEIADKFAVSHVIFAIKTRKAVPVMTLSVHSAAEQELIIPANERFKVVGIQTTSFGDTTVLLEDM